jgi:hypothetical protein
MPKVFEKTADKLEHEKIKTNYAEIIIKHPLEKPYYAIIYFDLADGELHEGFGSYCLEYVVEWKRDYFEIVDRVAADNVSSVDKLRRYEDLEEQGRLIKLPCKIGDVVYRIVRRQRGDCFVRPTILGKHNLYRAVVNDEFGKTVFLTAEEAEAAIYEKGGR